MSARVCYAARRVRVLVPSHASPARAARGGLLAALMLLGVSTVGAQGQDDAQRVPAQVVAAPSAAAAPSATAAPSELLLTADELALAHEFSPLPRLPVDPTNAVADDPAAALLGQALFFDPRLSANGEVSCSTCHDPDKGWGDGRDLAVGVAVGPRHAMTLWNVAYNRWFFWDGRKDTLWSQALGPIEEEDEHAFSRLALAHVLADDPDYARAYASLFGPLPDLSAAPPHGRPVPDDAAHPHNLAWESMTPAARDAVDDVFVNFGKSVAAFERHILTRRAPFDVFVEGLVEDDDVKRSALSPAAQRGFSLFVGKGRCFTCHDGPNFSDGEFHANRVPVKLNADPGRARGIQQLLTDPFNTRSRFADDDGHSGRTRLSLAPRGYHAPGDFKTPSLRNLSSSAPYMHEGQIDTLAGVLAFYSTLDGASPADPTGERLIEPRHFSQGEIADLLAFLEALTDETLPQHLKGPPDSLGLR